MEQFTPKHSKNQPVKQLEIFPEEVEGNKIEAEAENQKTFKPSKEELDDLYKREPGDYMKGQY